MTLSLAAVFIPVLFMGGILGRLFHEFAVTIGVAILISGFVSLTLTPMLCSRFLRPHGSEARTAGSTSCSSASSTACSRVYERGARAGRSRHRRATHGRSRSSSWSRTVLAVRQHAQGLPAERGHRARSSASPRPRRASRSRRWCAHQQAVAAIVQADPDVEAFMSSCRRARRHQRAATPASSSCASSRATSALLGRRGHRRSCARSWRRCPGIRVFLQNPPPIRIGGQLTKSQYQFTLQGPDTAELYQLRADARGEAARAARLPGRDQRPAAQEPAGAASTIDRDKASALGVTRASRSRTRSTTPTARARSRPSTRPTTSTR